MDRSASPLSASASEMPDGSAPPSPAPSDAQVSDAGIDARKKTTRKKRKVLPGDDAGGDELSQRAKPGPKKKKRKEGKEDGAVRKKPRKQVRKAQVVGTGAVEELSAAQLAANEQMRKVLEEDKYSAVGSIVDTDSEDEDTIHRGRGGRSMDRANILAATRKRLWMERMNASGSAVVSSQDDENEGENDDAAALSSRPGRKKKKRRGGRRSKEAEGLAASGIAGGVGADDVVGAGEVSSEIIAVDESRELAIDHDDVSIFGATTGSSNATWVQCDKCKKWRRLRGVVDEKKLPSKWYCSMNKNDPERSRCSAPEEKYETPNTPESAADARARKHLRIWVRRLQCNEAYEARQPTMTRGKKRSAMTSSKEPYEWVRCCNPSCGKWRAVLRCMDVKTHVLDRTTDGVWYCVMNTWDDKIASCAAPQENLPAIGCPPWVMQDEN